VEPDAVTHQTSSTEFPDPLLTANLAALEHNATQLTASAVALKHKLAAYVEHARKPRAAVPGGLLTAAQAAARLTCSVKTLDGHVRAGELKYLTLGRGTKRPRRRFDPADLDALIAARKKEAPPCSTTSPAPRIGTTTSRGAVIAFTDLQSRRPSAKPKK
jgi:hypothetical protein